MPGELIFFRNFVVRIFGFVLKTEFRLPKNVVRACDDPDRTKSGCH